MLFKSVKLISEWSILVTVSVYIVSSTATVPRRYYYHKAPTILPNFIVDQCYGKYLASAGGYVTQSRLASASGITQDAGQGTKKRILVTGGAGFIGSHLVDSLLLDGHTVIVLDNFSTGRRSNLQHWSSERLITINHDIVDRLPRVAVDEIYHMASIASPAHYMKNPLKTIKTNTIGTVNVLNLAVEQNATILLASTSEVYGDPLVHPQKESYWGNANTIGPRACYVESKRVCETWASIYQSQKNVSIRIARIFNTYGPRMQVDDGRVVSNFIVQALSNQTLSIYGDGNQTRSFLYISDLIEGLRSLMDSSEQGPTNIGHPDETSINKLVEYLNHLFEDRGLSTKHLAGLQEDPKRRKPCLEKAQRVLGGWRPKKLLRDGLRETLDYFKHQLERPQISLS